MCENSRFREVSAPEIFSEKTPSALVTVPIEVPTSVTVTFSILLRVSRSRTVPVIVMPLLSRSKSASCALEGITTALPRSKIPRSTKYLYKALIVTKLSPSVTNVLKIIENKTYPPKQNDLRNPNLPRSNIFQPHHRFFIVGILPPSPLVDLYDPATGTKNDLITPSANHLRTQ